MNTPDTDPPSPFELDDTAPRTNPVVTIFASPPCQMFAAATGTQNRQAMERNAARLREIARDLKTAAPLVALKCSNAAQELELRVRQAEVGLL